jgi:O-antigen/teichoic acid export membrane protein
MRTIKDFFYSQDSYPRVIRQLYRRVSDSPLGYRLASGSLWSVYGGGATRILGLISAIVVARTMGKKEFGELGIIQSTVGVFGLVAAFGMDTTTMKYVAQFRMKDPAKTGRIIKLAELVSGIAGLLVTILSVVISPWICQNILAAPQLSSLLQIGSVLLFCGAVNSSQIGSLAGFEAFKVIMVINFLTSIFSFCASLIGVYVLGLTGVVYAMVATMVVTLLCNHFLLKKVAKRENVELTYRGCFQERSIITQFSFPAMLSGIMALSATWVSSAILVNTHRGYEEMGIYNAATVWKAPILFLPSIFGPIFLSVLSNLRSEGRSASFDKVLRYYLLLDFIVAALIAVVISLLAHTITSFYGSDYSSSEGVLILLAFASVPIAVANAIDHAISSHGKAWASFTINLLWACFLTGLTWALRGLGARGLVIAMGLSYLALFAARGTYLYRRLLR